MMTRKTAMQATTQMMTRKLSSSMIAMTIENYEVVGFRRAWSELVLMTETYKVVGFRRAWSERYTACARHSLGLFPSQK